MPLRSILVPFFASAKSEDALVLAIEVAKRFSAHVHVVHGEIADPEVLTHLEDPLMTSYQEALAQTLKIRTEERLGAVRAQFDAVMQRQDVPLVETADSETLPNVTWEVASGPEWESIAATAAVYDLVVVGGPAPKDEISAANLCAEAALFRSGRPLLLSTPERWETVGARILIGWNRSAQSGRAVSAALPFIRSAEAVRILTIETGSKQGPPPEALAENLRLHGVDAETRKSRPDYREVGEAVLEEATEFGADLIVTGAYSHSRLRDLIFGGVTAYILANADRPVLMVH